MKLVLLPFAATLLVAQAEPEPTRSAPAAQVTVTQSVELRGMADMQGLALDPNGARMVLAMVEQGAASTPASPAAAAYLEAIRAVALATLGRRRESADLVDRIVTGGTPNAEGLPAAWLAAAVLEDRSRMITVLKAADAVQTGPQDDALHRSMRENVTGMLNLFDLRRQAGPRRVALEALTRIGWPGDRDWALRDGLRLSLIEMKLAASDRAGAAELARQVQAPAPLLKLLVQRRYDGLYEAGDRDAVLAQALRRYDRYTAQRQSRAPNDLHALLSRLDLLMSSGRYAESLALVQPRLGDLPAALATSDGRVLAEQAAYALLELGRADEGVELFARLASVPLEVDPALLDRRINYASYLWSAGRARSAVDYALDLDRELGPRMNGYGRAWNWSALVCALASLGRREEASPWIERMAGLSGTEVPLTRAYLCVDDLDAAERLMVRRLAPEDPLLAILALQDWRLPEAQGAAVEAVELRLRQVRQRPAVREALDRVGRSLHLPLSRSYWGAY